jgi:hypothetical protein
MNNIILFETYIILGIAILIYLIYKIKKIFFSKKPLKDKRQEIKYKKHLSIMTKNLVELSKCTEHNKLTQITLKLEESLDYFEKYNLTIFDRPPHKIKETILRYSSSLIEYIYQIKHQDLAIDFFNEEEFNSLEEYQNESEEEKETRRQRRLKYKAKLEEEAIIDILHHNKDIEKYLDIQILKKMKSLQDIKRLKIK